MALLPNPSSVEGAPSDKKPKAKKRRTLASCMPADGSDNGMGLSVKSTYAVLSSREPMSLAGLIYAYMCGVSREYQEMWI